MLVALLSLLYYYLFLWHNLRGYNVDFFLLNDLLRQIYDLGFSIGTNPSLNRFRNDDDDDGGSF